MSTLYPEAMRKIANSPEKRVSEKYNPLGAAAGGFLGYKALRKLKQPRLLAALGALLGMGIGSKALAEVISEVHSKKASEKMSTLYPELMQKVASEKQAGAARLFRVSGKLQKFLKKPTPTQAQLMGDRTQDPAINRIIRQGEVLEKKAPKLLDAASRAESKVFRRILKKPPRLRGPADMAKVEAYGARHTAAAGRAGVSLEQFDKLPTQVRRRLLALGSESPHYGKVLKRYLG